MRTDVEILARQRRLLALPSSLPRRGKCQTLEQRASVLQILPTMVNVLSRQSKPALLSYSIVQRIDGTKASNMPGPKSASATARSSTHLSQSPVIIPQ